MTKHNVGFINIYILYTDRKIVLYNEEIDRHHVSFILLLPPCLRKLPFTVQMRF